MSLIVLDNSFQITGCIQTGSYSMGRVTIELALFQANMFAAAAGRDSAKLQEIASICSLPDVIQETSSRSSISRLRLEGCIRSLPGPRAAALGYSLHLYL
jgi:hypothetical protein